jgi:hypothetical protein
MLHFMILVILLMMYAVTAAMRRIEEDMIERYQPRRGAREQDRNLTAK